MKLKHEDDELPVIRARMDCGDLYSECKRAAEKLRDTPQAIVRYRHVFCEVLSDIAESHGEMLISEDGRTAYFAKNGKAFTNFAAIPLSVVHQFGEDGTKEDCVELLILGKDIPSKTVTIPSRELAFSRWIDNLGIDYIYEKSEIWKIKIIIQQMAKYAPVREEFCYFGWAPKGENYYIFNDRKLCGDDWCETDAKTACEHTLRMLGVAPQSLTFVLLAIAVLSLVHSRMVRLGAYFKGICAIVAQTQSFKTTLAALFFDWTDGRKADVNFEASTAAIIRTIGNSRDSTVVLDDYKPGATKTESREMLQKISTVIRLCSDDSGGIKRASVQNETITNTARCLVVVTAEHVHFEVQSTLARVLILELNGKSVDRDKLTYFQEKHSVYRECVHDLIRYIARQDIDGFCENLEKRFLQERDMLRTELFNCGISVDNRASDLCTWLNIGFSEFLQYAFSVKAVTQKEFKNYMEESQKIFLSLMEQQAERVAEMDGVRQFFKGLQILLETKEVHIGKLQSRNTNYAAADSRSAIGFRKREFVYLKNEVAFRKVVSYFQRYGREFAFSEAELRKRLADRGCINRKDGKTYIHRLSVNHESYQCIQFNESKFNVLLMGGQSNGSEGQKEISGNWGVHQNANAILGR